MGQVLINGISGMWESQFPRRGLIRTWDSAIQRGRDITQPTWLRASNMLAATIIGILLITAVLGLVLWYAARQGNRAFRDAAYRRRVLLRIAVFYAVIDVLVLVLVATGNERKEALYGLPISVAVIWFLVHAAKVTLEK
jgi:hypothetical protein